VTLVGVIDRRRQHVGEPHGAVVAQQQHPGIEHSGHASREQPGAGHHVEAEAAVMRDGRLGRRGTLAADHLGLAGADIVNDDRHIPARTIEVGLHHLQREGGGDGGIEGVPASFKHRHADRGRDPVGRRHHAEGALNLGPGGERVRIDVFHR
jgi:hypothetical protein